MPLSGMSGGGNPARPGWPPTEEPTPHAHTHVAVAAHVVAVRNMDPEPSDWGARRPLDIAKVEGHLFLSQYLTSILSGSARQAATATRSARKERAQGGGSEDEAGEKAKETYDTGVQELKPTPEDSHRAQVIFANNHASTVELSWCENGEATSRDDEVRIDSLAPGASDKYMPEEGHVFRVRAPASDLRPHPSHYKVKAAPMQPVLLKPKKGQGAEES